MIYRLYKNKVVVDKIDSDIPFEKITLDMLLEEGGYPLSYYGDKSELTFDIMKYFGEIDDCSVCPFEEGKKDADLCGHHMDYFCPCQYDKYRDMRIEDVVKVLYENRRNAEIRAEAAMKRKMELEKKKKEQQEKRRQTEWENYSLNKELTRLRSGIRKRKDFLSSMNSYATAVAFANQMMNNQELKRPERTEKHPYELEIEQLEKRIEEILLEKKKRAKERRVRGKNE